MRGYVGSVKGDAIGLLHPLPALLRSYSSTVGFVVPSLARPEKAMMRPSPSAKAVAYQRPSSMLCDWTKLPVAGSKIDARLSPVNWYEAVPPTTSTRPSNSAAEPLQKT